jgi:GTP-binding protein EngB required for normal cell division
MTTSTLTGQAADWPTGQFVPGLLRRYQALDRVVAVADGRLPDPAVEHARAAVDRARSRLGLSLDHTVVAFAGSTGSGKSSLFNRVAGLDLARTGVRRPTTGSTRACVWGGDNTTALLDWLEINPMLRVNRESPLDWEAQAPMQGLLLLDLPDHDSVVDAHREEVDRVVGLADVVVWVVDPQKYADAAIHERYLRPLASCPQMLVVVLNQVDRLPAESVGACVADLRRLLADDGLPDVPLYGSSATTGAGLDDLRAELTRRVQTRDALRGRLVGDLDAVLRRLDDATGVIGAAGETVREPVVPDMVRHKLERAATAAAGVSSVAAAAGRQHAAKATEEIEWPVLRTLRRLRPDPLQALLDGTGAAPHGAVSRPQLRAAVRQFGDEAADLVPPGWGEPVRTTSRDAAEPLAEQIDATLEGLEVSDEHAPPWWAAVRSVHWLLLVLCGVGLVWLAVALAIHGDLLPVIGVPLPIWLIVVTLAAGAVLGFFAGKTAAGTARGRQQAAAEGFHEIVRAVVDTVVVRPVQAELAAYADLRRALNDARQ